MEKIDSLFWLGTGFMLLLGVGLILLFLFYQTYLMKLRRREAEMLLKASLKSEKTERKRIAADLHDGVLSDLSATRNFISVIEKFEKDVEQKAKLRELQEVIQQTITNTRAICHKLVPPLIANFGLRLTLMDYVEKLNQGAGTQFSVVFPKELEQVLERQDTYELYRIIQEFSVNSLKYGKPTYFKISLRQQANGVVLELEDDGQPFDFFAAYKTSTGNGIKNIVSRVKAMGANLQQVDKQHGNHFMIYLKQHDESSNS